MATRISMTPQELERELAHLGELSLEELKARYEDITGSALPKFLRRAFAELVIGHALQCQVLGGLDRAAQKQIEALMAEIVPLGTAKPRPKNRKLRTGTRLIREWQGRVHEVVVTEEGYLWTGQSFGSLTEIARTITGTNWNGWVFFGVKKPKPSATPMRSGPRGRLRRPAVNMAAEEAVHG